MLSPRYSGPQGQQGWGLTWSDIGCGPYTVYGTLYTVHCTLFTVQRTVQLCSALLNCTSHYTAELATASPTHPPDQNSSSTSRPSKPYLACTECTYMQGIQHIPSHTTLYAMHIPSSTHTVCCALHPPKEYAVHAT